MYFTYVANIHFYHLMYIVNGDSGQKDIQEGKQKNLTEKNGLCHEIGRDVLC